MKDRIYTLDILRILSVFFVFLFHSNIHLGCNYKIFTDFISQGAIFMVLFFMLSGFSLYYNYYDKELLAHEDLKRFFTKRLIKIYPLYIFVYILFLIFYNTLTLRENIIIAPIELLLLQSFFNSLFNVLHNGGTWFISCLFFCYLLFPWLKGLLYQLESKKRLLGILYFISFLSPIVVKLFKINNIYSNPFFRLIEFFMGMFIADLVLKNKNKINKYATINIIAEVFILLVSVTLLKPNAFFINDYDMYNFISVPIFSALIYNTSKMKNKSIIRIANSLIIQYLSKISFAFFLSQFFTFPVVKSLMPTPWFTTHTNSKLIFSSLLINLLISIFMYEIIQKPFDKILTKKMIKSSALKNTSKS